jgi:hypothetical protein
MRIGGHGGIRRNQEREPIRGRTRNRLRTNGIIPTRTVVDDDGVAPRLGQSLGDDAGHGVGDAARRDRHDELDRAARIGLRVRGAAQCGEHADKRGEQHSLAHRTRHRPSPVDALYSPVPFAGRAEVRRARGLRQPHDMRRHTATLPRCAAARINNWICGLPHQRAAARVACSGCKRPGIRPAR